jgi:small basic protein
MLLVLATAFNLALMPLLACIEGSGRVHEIYRLRFIQNFCATCISWLVIVLGGGLYNAATISLINLLITVAWLLLKHPVLMRIAYSFSKHNYLPVKLLSWRTEIWPMQWRIAISWISGYFINQLFVPILFYYHSPVIAGQMGMSLAVSTMITFIGQAWLNAKAPTLGKLIAKKDWQLLDTTFYRLVWQSSAVVLLACISLVVIAALLQKMPIFHRLLPPFQLACLAGSALMTYLTSCIAQYLRSHKREPFMVVSVIGASLIAISAWFFGKYYGSEAMVIAIVAINTLYGFPSAVWIWLKYKNAWRHPG